jgi:cellulose synthase/poly-beta-1,6-N-acetylglucosamine synthase-like glycosyltransferase
MLLAKIVLFGSWFLILFNYGGYAVLALILQRCLPSPVKKPSQYPSDEARMPWLTFIVAAYNEADIIADKVSNCLAQDYPMDKVEWLFVTDGSTDATPDILKTFPQVRLLHRPERMGKTAALNRAVAEANNPIIIASDANTFLNKEAIRLIAAHYADLTVGGVAGEKKVLSTGAAVGQGEGLYWKYESALKVIDSNFYSVVGAAGELFSFRRGLYEPVEPDVILDDFIISMRITEKGYRVVYEPRAIASENPSFSFDDEGKRKVRIAAGGFQAVARLGALWKVWRFPRLSFLYISHRVMRWWVSPFCLILALVASTLLWINDPHHIYRYIWIAQVLFYLLAIISPILPDKGLFKAAKLPRYFLFMNLSVLQGFLRWIKGSQSSVWEKARRA